MDIPKALHASSTRFEILSRDHTILKFADISAALDFLRPFKDDSVQMEILRSLVSGGSSDASRLKPEEVLKQIASLLVRGEIKFLRSPWPLGAMYGEEEEAERPAEEASVPAKAPPQKSWIEICLRDADGQPVPGEKYRIKLPDGSVQEGSLDGHGHAEYYGINPGTCEVSFPGLDDDDWDFG